MKCLTDVLNFNDKSINGLTDELNVFYISEKFKKENKNILIVTSSVFEANKLLNLFKSYTSSVDIFPMDDFLTSISISVSPEFKLKRLEVLKNKSKRIIITNLTGFLKFLPDCEKSGKLNIKLKNNMIIDRNKLNDLLFKFGYKKESFVTSTGECSIRGYIVDIFLLEEDYPIRIEFFDNEIQSIRYFDQDTQRSLNKINEITINPISEIVSEKKSSLFDYLKDPILYLFDKPLIEEANKKLCLDIKEYNEKNKIDEKHMFYLNDLLKNEYLINSGNENYKSYEIQNFNSNFEYLKQEVNKYLENNKTVVFSLKNKKQINKIQSLFNETIITDIEKLYENKINIVEYGFNNGFSIKDYIVITENNIESLNIKNNNFTNKYKFGKRIKSFTDISVGDYVVHYTHGVGIYNGVITLKKNGLEKDYIQINYLGADKVYIPVERIDSIYKYTNKEGTKPKINKLNSVSWEQTKLKLRKKLKDISAELLNLYRERNKAETIPFIDFPEEEIFSHSFSYEETKDQLKAIEEINNDLKQKKPMDRLLCGDVGFGKTEVAFRGIFKAVLNGFQVAYLCPTTVLSKQQYKSALSRFKDFGVRCEVFNRFTSTKEKNIILKDLKSGKIDVIFGTHRLLSKDIEFKNIGLLIIDEEQRFGVSHKEKIKQIKSNINVLTLSATPIPRTLKMSLSGLKELSIIDTPPQNRYPIQTYVLPENEILLKDALYKELSRNGQVFVLFNNVKEIENKVSKIKLLVPEARICYAHGQMNKSELEGVMEDFVSYKYDILVCTTIIETGIDIPNANTLIVFDADRFGLSQLYQLRGRVGRSTNIAYSYLFYSSIKTLNSVAVKRLNAIKEFTELGSGYRIAARDLAIRGAGDLLGSEQAGFVASVGLDLYLKMLEEEINVLNGIPIEEDEDEVNVIDVDTHIDDNYVTEEDIKIEIHKKINEIDSYSKMLEIKSELEDRFGKVEAKMEIYMYEEWLEKLIKELKLENVIQTNKEISFQFSKEFSDNVKGDKLFLIAYNICPKFQIKYFNKRIKMILNIYNLPKHFVYYLVELLEKIKSM